MSEIVIDSHFKMSKKIAQLTKVIFHLYSRNEENEEVLKAIKRSNEKELENLHNEIVTLSNKLNSKTKGESKSEVAKKMEELTSKFELEKLTSQKNYNSFIKEVEIKECTIIKEKDKIIEGFKKEIDGFKAKMESKIIEISQNSKG